MWGSWLTMTTTSAVAGVAAATYLGVLAWHRPPRHVVFFVDAYATTISRKEKFGYQEGLSRDASTEQRIVKTLMVEPDQIDAAVAGAKFLAVNVEDKIVYDNVMIASEVVKILAAVRETGLTPCSRGYIISVTVDADADKTTAACRFAEKCLRLYAIETSPLPWRLWYSSEYVTASPFLKQNEDLAASLSRIVRFDRSVDLAAGAAGADAL